MMDSIENSPEKVTALKDARFIDTLAPEHEKVWDELKDSVRGAGGPFEEKFTPIWLDGDIPKIFRDRGMLVTTMSSAGMNELGVESICTTWGFGGSIQSFEKRFPEFNTELFAQWYKDGLEYEKENDVDLFGDRQKLDWAFELFDRDLLSGQEFDAILDSELYPAKEINRYAPRYEQPLTSDLIMRTMILGYDNGETYSPPSPKERAWGFDKLEDWLKHESGEEIELPKWLSVLTAEQGQNIYSELTHRVGRDLKPEIGWSKLRPAIKHFGLPLLGLEDRVLDAYYQVESALKKAGDVGEDNLDIQKSILIYVLDHKKADLHISRHLELAEKIAEASGDEELQERINQEKELLRQHEIDRQAREVRRREEERIRQQTDPEILARKENKKKFEGLLKVLREIG